MRRREKLKQPSCTGIMFISREYRQFSREYRQFSREYRQFSREYRQYSRELRRLRSLSTSSVLNRNLTRVRRQRQNDCYQYNNINLIAQKKYIIKSLTVVYKSSKRCGQRQNAYSHVSCNTLACQAAHDKQYFLVKLMKISLNVNALFYSFETVIFI